MRFGPSISRSLLVAIVASFLAACSPRPDPSAHLPSPSARAVLQIAQGGGMVAPHLPIDLIPQLTLWDDGTVLFGAPDGSIRVGTISASTRDALLAQARVLYATDRRMSQFMATDLPSTSFSVETAAGRKTVSVYGFTATPGDWPTQSQARSEELDALRRLYQDAKAALPSVSAHFRPDTAYVSIVPAPSFAAGPFVPSWPAELAGTRTGPDAQRALTLGGFGLHTRLVDGDLSRVMVVPVIPNLALPWDEWPMDGLPRHPLATAYTDDRYRFAGISRDELQTWYHDAMTARGWRQASPTGTHEQVWVRHQYFNDPLMRFTFEADSFRIENLGGYEQAIPNHPRVFTDQTCPGITCVMLRRTNADEARAWYDRHLPYMGWVPLGEPDVFLGMFIGPDRTRGGYPELRVSYEPIDGGTRVRLMKGDALIPSAGWPAPPTWAQHPLCEATRGGHVEIRNERVSLSPGLCVTLDESERVRIEVAYGKSFVELDRATGRALSLGSSPNEAAVAQELARIANGFDDMRIMLVWPNMPPPPEMVPGLPTAPGWQRYPAPPIDRLETTPKTIVEPAR